MSEHLWRIRMAWRTLLAGPLRVKVTVERPDGTELYHFYPLDRDVTYGMRVDLAFEIGSEFELSEV